MSWFSERRKPFPNVEYGLLHVLERERGGKPKDLAYAIGLPQNKCGAWLSILKRRDLIRVDQVAAVHQAS